MSKRLLHGFRIIRTIVSPEIRAYDIIHNGERYAVIRKDGAWQVDRVNFAIGFIRESVSLDGVSRWDNMLSAVDALRMHVRA